MAKENQTPDYSSFEKYEYGALAGKLAQSKESKRFAPGALEVLAGSKGLNLGEEAEGFVKGTQASKESIETAINIYNGKFEENRGEYSPAQLTGWYESVLSGLDEEDRNKIVNYLGKYEEPLKVIREKISDAINTLDPNAKKDKFTEEQKEGAREILRKYDGLLAGRAEGEESTLEVLDKYKFESLRPDAVESSRTQNLKNLASKL